MSFENITMRREACRLLAHYKQYTVRTGSVSWLLYNICTRTFNMMNNPKIISSMAGI